VSQNRSAYGYEFDFQLVEDRDFNRAPDPEISTAISELPDRREVTPDLISVAVNLLLRELGIPEEQRQTQGGLLLVCDFYTCAHPGSKTQLEDDAKAQLAWQGGLF
jgi:hypothetical protein